VTAPASGYDPNRDLAAAWAEVGRLREQLAYYDQLRALVRSTRSASWSVRRSVARRVLRALDREAP